MPIGTVVLIKIFTVLVTSLSLVSFVLYGWDKRQARLKRWRISEATFHWLSVLGGWPGAILGQKTFRHKTQKTKFRIWFWLAVTVNLIAMGLLLWWAIEA